MKCAEDLDCEVSVNTAMLDMSMMTGSGIKVQVKGRDLDKLSELAEEVAGKIETIEGIESVDNGIGETTDELLISVDKKKAAKYGMTVAQVFQLVAAEMADTQSMTSITTDVKELKVYVNTDSQTEVTVDDIKKIKFEYTDQLSGDKKTVPISDIVTFTDKEEMNSISRDAQVRYLEVKAELKDGYNIGNVGREVSDMIKTINVPEGYSLKATGEDETINEAMHQVLLMLLLAVILIYLIMVAQFQSLLSPFIIMFTIPLAFTGGFAALYFSKNEVSIIAMVGFVMLSGIIVNNGIVLIDYINQLRREGWAKKDAIIEASRTRLRPVLMTALTTIISMSTMAVGMGRGTEMSQPMAIVVVGGLIYGTLLTLVVVPCIYDAIHKDKDMREEDIDADEDDKELLEEAEVLE
jgi:HAE1 family hydrophobic/amphiphilic exporter-1